jgi:uroporphyrinogen-III decarboxylase
MENILCDFYLNPEPVHRLLDALTDFYCVIIARAGRELGADGIFTSDDIGMQTGPMFSPEIFREFFKPRYARLFKAAHEVGMHFWLHTCGDVRAFMDDFIEIGLDVIHPIQKYTMDEREVARRFGDQLCFWTGMDVQQILPRGTPEDVRREVRFMIDTYDRPDGGGMITAGNGVTPDVPLENLFAFYDETYNYGLKHRQQFK